MVFLKTVQAWVSLSSYSAFFVVDDDGPNVLRLATGTCYIDVRIPDGVTIKQVQNELKKHLGSTPEPDV